MRSHQSLLLGSVLLAQQLLFGLGAAVETRPKRKIARGPRKLHRGHPKPKGSSATRNGGDPYYEDVYYDEDSSLVEENQYYEDSYPVEEDQYYDDYYYYEPEARGVHKSGKKNGKKSNGYEVVHDPPPVTPRIAITGEAFSPAFSAAIPVGVENRRNLQSGYFQPGTVYLFNNYAVNTTNVTLFEIQISFDSEPAGLFWAYLDGKCTRMSEGTGYCHFGYTISDPDTGFILGTFVAEGVMEEAMEWGQMNVKGGTQLFMGMEGLVLIQAAILNTNFDPALIESATGDVFEDVDGYLHYLELSADPAFLLATA